MLSYASIWAVVLRHARMWRRDPNFILAGFYWPVLDILVWGFLGMWIGQSAGASLQNYATTALLGILLWQIVGRGTNYIMTALAEELWARNITNLFALPLTITEWMAGIVVFSAIIMLLVSLVSFAIIYFLYNVVLLSMLAAFCIFLPPLFLCSLWLGFTCLSIIALMGRRSTELAYVVGWFFLPFSGAYYPIEVLPSWAQTLSAYVPMSYVFSGMRGYLMNGASPLAFLVKGYLMSGLYAACALVLFVWCFRYTKTRGLARLAD